MEDKKPTLWQVIWLGVATIGMIGVFLGHHHHTLTLILGTAMLIVAKQSDNNQNRR